MSIRRHLCQKGFSAIRRKHHPKVTSVELPDYSPKVRAFPFAFSPEKAISRIGDSAFGGSNEGQLLRPTSIQPIYFPTWFISAELEAIAWISSESGSRSNTSTVQFEDLYLPGSAIGVERSLIHNRPTNIELARPFSPDLAHQWGIDVTCLPYDVLPFDILDGVRSLSDADAVISKNLRFSPQSIKMNLVVAYPILLPVYLVEYAPKESSESHGLLCPALVGAQCATRLLGSEECNEEPVANQDDSVDVWNSFKDAKANFQAILLNPKDSNLSSELSSWLTRKFSVYQFGALASTDVRSPIDMGDPRIREWTQEEVDPVLSWLRLERARAFVEPVDVHEDGSKSLDERMQERVDELYSWLRVDRPPGVPESTSKEFVTTLYQMFDETEREWQAFRAKFMPNWWKEWKESE